MMNEVELMKQLGDGDTARGRYVTNMIADRLAHARAEHPGTEWSGKGPAYGVRVIRDELDELGMAVDDDEGEDRMRDECLDVLATAVRFLNREWK